MKRAICLILISVLLLSGCSATTSRSDNTVEFFYLRSFQTQEDYQAYFAEGAIVPEKRDVSGHRDDLYYLLSMYLRGPLDSHLESPFPSGCTLTDVYRDGSTMTVRLSSGASLMDDLALTVASGCLAKTCMALADVDTVHIQSLSITNEILFSITVTSDNLLLEVTQPEETQ